MIVAKSAYLSLPSINKDYGIHTLSGPLCPRLLRVAVANHARLEEYLLMRLQSFPILFNPSSFERNGCFSALTYRAICAAT
jgi:hypothetical protein